MSGTRRPSVPAPPASGKRSLGTSSVTAPGSSRAISARVRAVSSGSAESACTRSKNITAAGLSGGRPLSA